MVIDIQKQVRHPALRWMAATLDGRIEGSDAVFESKFMLPWSFSRKPRLRNTCRSCNTICGWWQPDSGPVLVITEVASGSKSQRTRVASISTSSSPPSAEFWRCVESGEPPRLFGVEPPKPRIEAVRVVDMSASNSWAEFAGLFRNTRQAFLEHERSKTELKALMPEDAKEGTGHGICAKRSKSVGLSSISSTGEDRRAPLQ